MPDASIKGSLCCDGTADVLLSQIINEKQQMVQEYENGKAVPNQQVNRTKWTVGGYRLGGAASRVFLGRENSQSP
jgi:hypothetical protein